ncbi:MAG: protein jag [Selenomonadaceae bacterium]|nr:protein jag [Selenomonadaceae bacterium]
MAQPVEFTGKSVEDALQTALNQLGVGKDDVDVEVLETPSKGIFGFFGTKPAKIKVTVKELPKVEPAAEQVEEGEEVIVEPPTIVNFKVVPVIEDLPKVDEKFVEEDAPQVKPSPVNPFLRDEVINKAKKFLSDLFGAINMDIKISAHEVDDNIILDLSGEESRVIIGKHGQTIDALQYLTNLAANGNSEDKVRFILDVGNYRERREETLQKLARSVADRAVRMKQAVKMEPMTRHDRRIVHLTLQDNKRVTTESHGAEPFRYIVVSPVPKKKK